MEGMQVAGLIVYKGKALAGLAAAAEEVARYDQAGAAYTDAMACLEGGVRRFPEHVGLREALVAVLRSGAQLCWLLGDLGEQRRRLERALGLVPAGAAQVGLLLDLAGSARDLGSYREALSLVESGLLVCSLPERSRLLILAAEAWLALGEDRAALAAAQQALEAVRQEIEAGGESPWRLRRLVQAAHLAVGAAGPTAADYASVGREASARAVALAREALAGGAEGPGPVRDLAWLSYQYAEVLRGSGDLDGALSAASHTVQLCDGVLETLAAHLNLIYIRGLGLKAGAGALVGLGDWPGAEARYRAAAEAFGQVLDTVPQSLDELKERAGVWKALGDVLAQQGRGTEAAGCWHRALQDCERLLEVAPGRVDALALQRAVAGAVGERGVGPRC